MSSSSSSSSQLTTMHESSSDTPFLFPQAQSSVLPDPSRFFSPHLLSSPLPTSSFFQNFLLQNGDKPEYIHPYLIKSSNSSLSLCYPSLISTSSEIYQKFTSDLTISPTLHEKNTKDHVISSFSGLSVTLHFPPHLTFYLVRGSPFLTCNITSSSPFYMSTTHAILSLSSNTANTKHIVQLHNNQTWILYSFSPMYLTQTSPSLITCSEYSGIVRCAVLPHLDPRHKAILDKFSSCYPVSGHADFTGHADFSKPFCLEYKWEKKGMGNLLLLAHPLHLRLLSNDVTILEEFRYGSIDGELVGVVGDSWVLKTEPIPITWQSIWGIDEELFPEIVSALRKDVKALSSTPVTNTNPYFYGKTIARAARLALIAEAVSFPEVIPAVKKFLQELIEPWLDSTFFANGFLFEAKWGGLITKQGSKDPRAEYGFSVYNNHHCTLGYFLYGIAVLVKFDPAWGKKYKPKAYSLMEDFMYTGAGGCSDSHYPRLRSFDEWKLHSWAGGLSEFVDGRNQMGTSEAVNSYYSAALMGLIYSDINLLATGSTLAALEIQASKTWWHVREAGEEGISSSSKPIPEIFGVGYMDFGSPSNDAKFRRENRVVGVLWANKRDCKLWFAPPERKECRLGIQLLPVVPISEILFSDVGFARELVKWALQALGREGAGEEWKGFVHAVEGVYDKQGALEKIRNLKKFDNGNSFSNMLWWIHSRPAHKLLISDTQISPLDPATLDRVGGSLCIETLITKLASLHKENQEVLDSLWRQL